MRQLRDEEKTGKKVREKVEKKSDWLDIKGAEMSLHGPFYVFLRSSCFIEIKYQLVLLRSIVIHEEAFEMCESELLLCFGTV